MFYVYVLKSLKDSNRYYGFTENLIKRLKDHNLGKITSTKPRIPFTLIYHEQVATKNEALRKERYFKSGFGRKYINNKVKTLALSSNG